MLQGWHAVTGPPGREARAHLPRRQADWDRLEVASIAAAALDSLNYGVALLSTGRRVHFMNQMGRRLCSESDALRLEEDRLVATSSVDIARVNAALTRVLAGDVGAVLRVAGAGGRPLSVIIKPLPAAALPVAARPDERSASAMMLFTDPARLAPVPRERLIQAYGLTCTEASFTSLLLQGRPLTQIAHQLGIRLATVRTHLRAVLAKTGTHRQSELVWRLLQEVGWVL